MNRDDEGDKDKQTLKVQSELKTDLMFSGRCCFRHNVTETFEKPFNHIQGPVNQTGRHFLSNRSMRSHAQRRHLGNNVSASEAQRGKQPNDHQ